MPLASIKMPSYAYFSPLLCLPFLARAHPSPLAPLLFPLAPFPAPKPPPRLLPLTTCPPLASPTPTQLLIPSSMTTTRTPGNGDPTTTLSLPGTGRLAPVSLATIAIGITPTSPPDRGWPAARNDAPSRIHAATRAAPNAAKTPLHSGSGSALLPPAHNLSN